MPREINPTSSLKLNKIFSVLNAANSAFRYSRDIVSSPESILIHTGWVALWCLFCAKDLEQNHWIKINYSNLLQKALIHDFDEIGTGDIPRITKYASLEGLKCFKKIERNSVIGLERFIELRILNLWESAKDDSIEGTIIKLADFAAVIYKIWEEIIIKNNYAFVRVSSETKDNFKKISQEIISNNKEIEGWTNMVLADLEKILDEANKICMSRKFIAKLDFDIGGDND